MIDFYSFGKIIVDDKFYSSDLIITPTSIISQRCFSFNMLNYEIC